MRKLKRRAQEMHGYHNVTYNSRGKAHWRYDPFTGEDYGWGRSRHKLRVIEWPNHAWRKE
jgi:hypothetical protein